MDLKRGPAAVALASGLAIWFLVPVPEGVTPNAWHLLALFVGTIVGIIGKALPIGAMALLAITLVAATGVTNDKPGGAIADALSGFSNSLIWLIGVSIMISRGLIKTGLGARIGYFFISLFGKKTLGVGYALTLVGAHHRAGHAQQHRARRRHHPPHHAGDCRQLRLRPRARHRRAASAATWRWSTTTPTPSPRPCSSPPQRPTRWWSSWWPRPPGPRSTSPGAPGRWRWPAAGPGGPGADAAGAVPDVPARDQKHARRRSVCPGQDGRAGPDHGSARRSCWACLRCCWCCGPTCPACSSGRRPTFNCDHRGLHRSGSVLLVTGVLSWDDVLKEKSAWDTVVWFSALVMMATFLNKLGLIAVVLQQHRNRHRRPGAGLVAGQRLAGADLPLRALPVRQHHGPHHRHVRRLLRCRSGARAHRPCRWR